MDPRLSEVLRQRHRYVLVRVGVRQPLTADEERALGAYGIVLGWGAAALTAEEVEAISAMEAVEWLALAV